MPYSDKYEIFWFTPARTASRSCAELIEYLNFSEPRSHYFYSNEIQKNYYLICNVRNPYSRVVSIYNLLKKEINDPFEVWLEKVFEKDLKISLLENSVNVNILKFLEEVEKKPDYLVRTESLTNDLLNLEVVKNNFDLGLEKIFTDWILSNQFIDDLKIKKTNNELYTTETANYVYEKLKKEFEIFGYSKDSWRNGTP